MTYLATSSATTAIHSFLGTCGTGSASTVMILAPVNRCISTASTVVYPFPVPEELSVKVGQAYTLNLPDGAKLKVETDGSYQLRDENARITYRACRIRAFNSFLNASDKIEAFIRFCGQAGVRKNEMLKLPLDLFVSWLVLEAAKADGEPEPNILLLPDLRKRQKPRCLCGRFLKRSLFAAGVAYCSGACLDRHLVKLVPPGGQLPGRKR